MNATDTYIRVRIDKATIKRASEALKSMGLSTSDAIRLLLIHIADEHRFPFEFNIPNTKTQKAINELEAGKAKRAKTAENLMKNLNADD